MYQTVLVVSVFFTYLKRKNFAVKNIFNESAQIINCIELQFSNIHLSNILCDEMGTTRKALTWHSEEQCSSQGKLYDYLSFDMN